MNTFADDNESTRNNSMAETYRKTIHRLSLVLAALLALIGFSFPFSPGQGSSH